MTHLLDTSVLHKQIHFPAVASVVDELGEAGALFSTCPVVAAEFCFSARDNKQLAHMQSLLSDLYQLESDHLMSHVTEIQHALWRQGLVRAASAADVLISAYALDRRQILVSCDTDFLHIARALKRSKSASKLNVMHVRENGDLTLEN